MVKKLVQMSLSARKSRELTHSVREIGQSPCWGSSKMERGIQEGWREEVFFSPELGAKDGMVSLLYRFWKPITVKWEKEPKDCVPLSGAAEGVARMGFSVQWWRIWENGGRAKWREELEEAKYTAMSLLWLHFSSLIELWGWFSTQLTAAECIHALLKGTFPKIIPATVQSWSNQDPTSCIHSDWALWEKF